MLRIKAIIFQFKQFFLSLFLLPLAPLCRNLKFTLSFCLMFYEVSTTFLKSLIYTLSRTSDIAGMLFWQLRSVYFLTINFNFFLKIPWNLVSLAVSRDVACTPFWQFRRTKSFLSYLKIHWKFQVNAFSLSWYFTGVPFWPLGYIQFLLV